MYLLLGLILMPALLLFARPTLLINEPSNPALMTSGPTLYIPGGVTAHTGELVDVPVAFDSFGAPVAALSFSLDYEQECLAFEAGDQDGDGAPDGFIVDAPAQFFPSLSWDVNDEDGELDVVLADYIPPLAILQDSAALFTFRFRVVCPLLAGQTRVTILRFAATPPIGFSDPVGFSLPGNARDGLVQIVGGPGGGMGTPTPTPSLPPTNPPSTGTPTPAPAPVVLLEMTSWPERLSYADRHILLSMDYAILSSLPQATFQLALPPQTRPELPISTAGWQCTTDATQSNCWFPLSGLSLQNSRNGRIFLALTVDSPLPSQVTQLAFAVTLLLNDRPDYPLLTLTLPVLPNGTSTIPSLLGLAVQTNATELTVGSDQQLAYTMVYTNHSNLTLAGVSFHLILPSVADLQATTTNAVTWNCSSVGHEQQDCVSQAFDLPAEARTQQQFVLKFATSSRLNEMNALVVVAYAERESKILISASSVVPIRRRCAANRRVLLPVVMVR
jgi:hypothetical protein